MFTGLIEEVGAIARLNGSNLTILAQTVLEGLHDGDSVAVNGVCLTVTQHDAKSFSAQASPETLARTTLSQLRPGDGVNLERAMQAGGRFGGHFVLGHVDGVGRVHSIQQQGNFSLWRFQAEPDVARYLVPKGSIAIDGISLTIVEPMGDTFGVAIIPETIQRTTLAMRCPGDAINIEADMLAKHIFHFMNRKRDSGITIDFLSRHGFT